jgi:hypothetical protein
MQLVGHAAVGITLTRLAGATHPLAALGIGWFSHYLADFFPHGDEDVGEWATRGNFVKRMLAVVAVDGLVTVAVFAWYASRQSLSPAQLIVPAAAALGSFLPDIMWGLEKLFKRRLFGPFEKLHGLNHNFFHVRVPSWYGLPLQLVIIAAIWWWLTIV